MDQPQWTFRCKLIRHQHLQKFEIVFPKRFTEDRHKFAAVCKRVERELGLASSVSIGDGLRWSMPFRYFYKMPTLYWVGEVLKQTFRILLSTHLEVEVTETHAPEPSFDPDAEELPPADRT